MSNVFFISQLLVLIAYSICGIAFLQKKQIKILIFVSIFNLLMLIQYALLNATSGIITCLINILRNLIFISNIKYNRKNSIYLLAFFSCLSICLTTVLYSSYLDIFPCLIALLDTYSYWTNNTQILRITNFLCSLCYIIYAIPIKSYITIVSELYLIVTIVIGYIKYELNYGKKMLNEPLTKSK